MSHTAIIDYASGAVTETMKTGAMDGLRQCEDCRQWMVLPLFKRWGSGYLSVCQECYRGRHRARVAREKDETLAALTRSRGRKEACREPLPEPPVVPLPTPPPPGGEPLVEPELVDALRARMRELAAEAMREIAPTIVRGMVEELAPAIARTAVRELLAAVVRAAI